MNKVIYHYTTFGHLEKIIESGFLKVSPWEKENKIKRPALWLSTNADWENSATKGFKDNTTGECRSLTFEEQSNIFGCIRIMLPFSNTFCNWKKFKCISEESIELCNQLEIIGKEQGSNPEDWYVSFEDVPTSKILGIDYWDRNKWEDILVKEIEI